MKRSNNKRIIVSSAFETLNPKSSNMKKGAQRESPSAPIQLYNNNKFVKKNLEEH
jgi:hypothetical protein